MARRALIGAAAFGSALTVWLVPAAGAADQPPPVAPAISQYVETLPTSSGGVVSGSSSKSQKLSSKLQAEIRREGGKSAASLEAIVTSSAYGAPQATSRPKKTQPGTGKRSKVPATPAGAQVEASGPGSGLSAAASSVGQGAVLALVLALVALTIAAGAFVARRRRSST